MICRNVTKFKFCTVYWWETNFQEISVKIRTNFQIRLQLTSRRDSLSIIHAFTYWITSSLEAILPSTMRCTICQWSSSVSVWRQTSGVSASFDADPTSCIIQGCSMILARLARWLGSRTSIFRIMLHHTNDIKLSSATICGLQLVLHRTIRLMGHIGPVTLVRSTVSLKKGLKGSI